jgi:hypothetical protein
MLASAADQGPLPGNCAKCFSNLFFFHDRVGPTPGAFERGASAVAPIEDAITSVELIATSQISSHPRSTLERVRLPVLVV